MRQKAESFKQYNEAAVIELIVRILPEATMNDRHQILGQVGNAIGEGDWLLVEMMMIPLLPVGRIEVERFHAGAMLSVGSVGRLYRRQSQ